MHADQNTKGFTLVEILMVIFIIGLLSVLAIAGYSEYRKIALMNLSADSVVSQINEERENVRYGIDTQTKNVCSGIFLSSTSEVSLVSVSYNPKKKWVDTDWVQGECAIDDSALSAGKKAFNTALDIQFESASSDDAYVLFVPPDGHLLTSSSDDQIEFNMTYKNSAADKYKRTINIDLKSGNASWKYYE